LLPEPQRQSLRIPVSRAHLYLVTPETPLIPNAQAAAHPAAQGLPSPRDAFPLPRAQIWAARFVFRLLFAVSWG